MNEPTLDPSITIIDRGTTPDGEAFVTYRQVDGDITKEWTVLGTCICCGVCEIGSVNPYLIWQGEPGTPYACIDSRHPDRIDAPVAPSFFGDDLPVECTLRLQE